MNCVCVVHIHVCMCVYVEVYITFYAVSMCVCVGGGGGSLNVCYNNPVSLCPYPALFTSIPSGAKAAQCVCCGQVL